MKIEAQPLPFSMLTLLPVQQQVRTPTCPNAKEVLEAFMQIVTVL